MPLFQGAGKPAAATGAKKRRTGSSRNTDEDGCPLSLTQLCLLSVADNMKDVWVKDYSEKYLDHYTFRHIMGPFHSLSGELVEELTRLLCSRKQLSRAALHLLLVPQLRSLSLGSCPGLVTPPMCALIASNCQGLFSLDLSSSQLSFKVLSDTLCRLPALRSLSLAGTNCDRQVIRTIAQNCTLLHHLDVSHCHFLSCAALLPLGGGAFCSSSGSPSSSKATSPCPLRSLLALDIGFEEEEGDSVAVAAYLLLSLPHLQRVSLAGLLQACNLIQQRAFDQTDVFADREGLPCLEEVWLERTMREATDTFRGKMEGTEEDTNTLCEVKESDSDDNTRTHEGKRWSQNPERRGQTQESLGRRVVMQSDDKNLILRLQEVKNLTDAYLDNLGQLCPHITSISLDLSDAKDTVRRNPGPLLFTGLQTWSDQLRSLSVLYPGPLVDLLPGLQVAGSSLVSLTLEGIRTSPHTPLLEVIQACSNLRELVISAEPPTTPQEEAADNQQDDQVLPCLPNLCTLTLNFSYEHNQMKPVMSWMSLKRVIRCLLTGSCLLKRLTLVSLPSPLNSVLQDVLHKCHLDSCLNSSPGENSRFLRPVPLGRLRHLDLSRTDVTITTVGVITQRCKRLEFLDLRYCWRIKQREWMKCVEFSCTKIVWQ
ncbi:uncharacterized protein si:ch211-214j8.12 [Thalassophryne amazonica]|uniref:uncharacterized protein si:ch211-214j8.12 n=1 Tax=Thalassophryne amazonica TaxID=390379 RepID=UPI001472619C|nr:uncharacterized protein si:ch211-214j8.12 [Thalassophryne amazonica]